MPWIGAYVSFASLICALLMSVDTFRGFKTKRYWFPSKYFSLDATSLTLLAVAMKLPVDLTTRMYAVTDRLAKVSSLVLLSTAMANFLTSLGSMTDKDVLMNVTALGILVITVTANVCVQVVQMHSFLDGRLAFVEEILAVGSMLLLLVMFVSSALMIPSTKRYLEKKYREMHRSALNEEERVNTKYWIMAETSNPQFVIARSVTCTTSGIVSLVIAVVLLEAEIRMAMEFNLLHQYVSSYGWSTRLILLAQTIGVIVGTIAPASRWFVAINFRSSNEDSNSIRTALTVEGYWTQKMVEWRQSSLSFKIRHRTSRKAVHDVRGLILKLCIFVQYLIVLASKIVLCISVCITSPIIACVNCVKRLKRQKREIDIGHYVMLLDGEVELPSETLKNICEEVDKVIHKGKKQKPKNLLRLLHKSSDDFNGVADFDSRRVPSLHSGDLPYCWALPAVTLTSIALALPNVDEQKSRRLLSSVTEGLCFVKLIDDALDKKGSLGNIITAADVVWVGVELYHMWQDKDLHETSLKGKNADEILNELGNKAEKTVLEFMRDSRDCLMKNPLNWPANIVAANSMYRMSRTILLSHGKESDESDEDLFEILSIMIADILAACLTNLAHVITMKCHRNAIEEREESVRQAALLLGQTEEILAVLQRRELPLLAPDKAADIEEWRALVKPML
ncbi:hypothetical protein PHJA_001382500 [Phtheirospermum japonicum]|uniref:Uncharacterized protein n=1 Tax=Phtheirospermum japonicum TaxID=374723 RepID=A0A830C8M1_9LAMI|nr:hypothetical protein PHJA_001382500 [Phtheirospermum japonicum]